MTSVTNTTTDDFRSTRIFTSPPEAVFSALTEVDALTDWWVSAAGGAKAGETLRFLMGDQEVVMQVAEVTSPFRVRWNVLVCEPVTDWVGTAIIFDLVSDGEGTELRFHHQGLTPGLECFEDCNAGWTHYLNSLVDFVDTGTGSPQPPSEHVAAWRAEHGAH